MTSFATPSVAVHEKLPDSSTPSGSCQALPRPTPFGKTGEGRGETTPPTPPLVRAHPVPCPTRACPSSPPRHPCVPVPFPAPPVRSHPLPRLAVCVPFFAAPPPVRASPLRSATRACPSSLPRRSCDPIIRRDRPPCLSLYLWASTGASPLHTLLTFELAVASCTPFVFLCL